MSSWVPYFELWKPGTSCCFSSDDAHWGCDSVNLSQTFHLYMEMYAIGQQTHTQSWTFACNVWWQATPITCMLKSELQLYGGWIFRPCGKRIDFGDQQTPPPPFIRTTCGRDWTKSRHVKAHEQLALILHSTLNTHTFSVNNASQDHQFRCQVCSFVGDWASTASSFQLALHTSAETCKLFARCGASAFPSFCSFRTWVFRSLTAHCYPDSKTPCGWPHTTLNLQIVTGNWALSCSWLFRRALTSLCDAEGSK